jgi:ring-1,2-phenylacetyl-CoA epoxidase subunit PaaD
VTRSTARTAGGAAGGTGGATLADAVHAAIAGVDDPEMPGVSIVELGLLESIECGADGSVVVGLIPTFSGCPAQDVIAASVRRAVAAIDAVSSVHVQFLRAPAWTMDRVTARGERALAERLGIAVERGGVAPCPRCASPTEQRSLFGPTRCRAVHVCTGCGEVVEVMR